MLERDRRRGAAAREQFVERAKDKNDTTRLMGFGHRVYKNYDPRAAILKKACDEVLAALGVHEPAARDRDASSRRSRSRTTTSSSRKLYPNVDFYSGVIYKAIGIPVNMFTVDVRDRAACPAGSRSGSRCARDPDFRIGRPRQIYTGATVRAYAPIEAR